MRVKEQKRVNVVGKNSKNRKTYDPELLKEA